MSPVLYRWKGYRILFYSREEDRAHVHVIHKTRDMDAKIWLEPRIEVAYNRGIPARHLKAILKHLEENHEAYLARWRAYHGGSQIGQD